MKTTLDIPDPLFKNIKAHAALEGLKLKDVIASALTAYLQRPNAKSPLQHKPCPFPLFRGKGGALLKTMSNQTIAELEAKEDCARHRRSFGR